MYEEVQKGNFLKFLNKYNIFSKYLKNKGLVKSLRKKIGKY